MANTRLDRTTRGKVVPSQRDGQHTRCGKINTSTCRLVMPVYGRHEHRRVVRFSTVMGPAWTSDVRHGPPVDGGRWASPPLQPSLNENVRVAA